MKINDINYNKKYQHSAFTLAEVLMTMIIIAVIALATTWAVPKKIKIKKDIANPHGSFACTVDASGNQRYIKGHVTSLPDISEWSTGNCNTAFEMPKGVDELSVIISGGGGGGGRAAYEQHTGSLNATLSSDGAFVTIDNDGIYEIEAYGATGSASHIFSWTENGSVCSPSVDTSPAGKSFYYKGKITLEKDTIVQKISGSRPTQSVMFPGACGGATAVSPPFEAGTDGRNFSVILAQTNGSYSELVSLEGSKSGTFECNPYATCGVRYSAEAGENSKLSGSIATGMTTLSSGPNDYVGDGVVRVSWSDSNPAATYQNYPGCGGSAGVIMSSAYPIMSKNQAKPTITIGTGGSGATATVDGSAGGQSSFGNIVARGGAAGGRIGSNKGYCVENGDNGSVGQSSFVTFTESAGGSGGTAASVTGSNGTGFGSGGGGGSFSGSTMGGGGKGANGLVWIIW